MEISVYPSIFRGLDALSQEGLLCGSVQEQASFEGRLAQERNQ